MSKNLCIIPARGGSKRIPRKNIRPFFGKPIITYSIEMALKSGLFDEVMVSTDDEEIAVIANEYGANVPFLRSERMADDQATTMQVLEEVMEMYRKKGEKFDNVCCIYPTAVLMTIEKLKAGFKLLESGFEMVLPVVPFSYPIWRGLERNATGKIRMLWPEYLNTRSQDLQEVFHDAGQWYWMKSGAIGAVIFGPNTGAIELDPLHVQDIDNLSDWHLAELKYEYLQSLK